MHTFETRTHAMALSPYPLQFMFTCLQKALLVSMLTGNQICCACSTCILSKPVSQIAAPTAVSYLLLHESSVHESAQRSNLAQLDVHKVGRSGG